MPILRLAPARKLTTSVVFEIGSAEVGPADLEELGVKDVLLLDRLTMDPVTRKGTATVRGEGPEAFLANLAVTGGQLVATLAAPIEASRLDPSALVVVLDRQEWESGQRPVLSVGQRFILRTEDGRVDLEWRDERIASGQLVLVEGRPGVHISSL